MDPNMFFSELYEATALFVLLLMFLFIVLDERDIVSKLRTSFKHKWSVVDRFANGVSISDR